jgi:hypothetical protein
VSLDDLERAARGTASSTRESSDEDPPPPVATNDGLEEIGQVLLVLVSKVVDWVMRRGGSRTDWRMAPGEAASIARPATRMLSRRMQIRSDLADATDVGRGADGILSYVFRILSGQPAGESPADQAAEADRQRARATQPVEHSAPEPPAGPSAPRHIRREPAPSPSSFAEVGRDVQPESAPVGTAVTGGPTKSFFAGGMEDV